MRKVKVEDLCYSCRQMHVKGTTVENFLNTAYSDPGKWLDYGGDVGVLVALNGAIVMGDGCTTCGEKVLNWGRDLGLVPPRLY